MKKIIVLIGIVSLVFAIITVAEASNSHVFKKAECFLCHLDPSNEPSKLINKPISEMCASCHRMVMKTSSHPVEIEPYNMEIPPDMPLRNGLVTCNTCHNIHADKESESGLKTYYLRNGTPGNGSACSSCHLEKDMYDEGNQHAYGIDVAHVGVYYRNIKMTVDLDALTVKCISCHDGDIARDVGHNGPEEHPLGSNYREASRNNTKLRDLYDVDGRLKLFNGKIGCGTCHDIFSTKSALLVKDNHGSALCTSCHLV
jgi:predicted CXXCH cytochrome family protein